MKKILITFGITAIILSGCGSNKNENTTNNPLEGTQENAEGVPAEGFPSIIQE